MTELLTLIIGLLLGFYGRDIRDRINYMYEFWQEKRDRHEGGIVKPSASLSTRQQPIDLSSETGGVLRPRPDAAAILNKKEREKKIRQRS